MPESAPATGVPPFPRATYRLQFHKGFTLDDATALLPYLSALGISHVYASPFLAARPGSTHGYDIIDHNRLNPEIGDADSFNRLAAALRERGMGLILDFVPNHVGVGPDNPWWMDVLEWGEASPYAAFFDIDWSPPAERLRGKVLLPVLGDHYGDALENGEIVLRFDAEHGSFAAHYHQHRFPIAIRDYPRLLRPAQEALGGEGEALAPLVAGFARLGRRGLSVRQAAVARREADALRAQLAALAKENRKIRRAIAAAVAGFNGVPGKPESFRALHALLERQAYQVAFWRVAANDINYRRFFDINDLAGLNIQNPELFEISHRLVFQLIAEGKLQGLRLDHVDGLYDPRAYCRRLQDRAAYLVLQARAAPETAVADAGAEVRLRNPFYVVVEKILAAHEALRPDWPVDGTTGYEFMNLVNGLFVDPAGCEPLTETYHRFLGREEHFPDIVAAAKRQILRGNLASELNVLAGEIYRLAQQSWRTRDYTQTAIRDALIDVVTYFPVYRTYVTAEGADERDRQYIAWAVGQARKNTALVDTGLFDFLHAVLTTDLKAEGGRGYRRRDLVRAAMKFQQMTGPVMAKAFEDTALYRYYRLVSLNEVGGEPERFGVSPAAFHRVNADRLRQHPFSMLATATHDHKRGEDSRARIDVLSGMPEEWGRRVARWSRLNRLKRRELEGFRAPGRNDEYLVYQSLVGAWPLEIGSAEDDRLGTLADRMAGFMIKAVREAKLRSNWTAPDAEYEQAVESFVRGILDPRRSAAFLADLLDFLSQVAPAGAVNGLAQTLLKLAAPGVPDIYQGCEFWDQSLVDPDNRRPVDYAARAAALREAAAVNDPAALLADWRSGRAKQYLIARALDLRRRLPALFAAGDYVPVEAEGPLAEHVVAFLRRGAEAAVLVAVPRLARPFLRTDGPLGLDGAALRGGALRLPDWLHGADLRDALADREHAVGADGALPLDRLLETFPVALLCTGTAG